MGYAGPDVDVKDRRGEHVGTEKEVEVNGSIVRRIKNEV